MRTKLECNEVRALLLLKLLGIPSKALEPTHALAPETSRRWQRFVQFYNHPECLQRLKEAALCLQIAEACLKISAQKATGAREPTIVRLSKGEAEEAASAKLLKAITTMQLDPTLKLSSVLPKLLTTHGHAVLRFRDFKEFPFSIWKLTSHFNGDSHVSCIEDFLSTSPEHLDAGYSLPLQRNALEAGSLARSISYMLQPEIQSEMTMLVTVLSASSLDVERKHAQDKKQEGNRVRSVASASRNAILQKYSVGRSDAIGQAIVQRKAWKKRRTMSSVSLAVQRNPTLLPRPGGFAGPEHAHAGDLQALRGYLQEHRQDSRISFLLPLVSHISLTPLTSFPCQTCFILGSFHIRRILSFFAALFLSSMK